MIYNNLQFYNYCEVHKIHHNTYGKNTCVNIIQQTRAVWQYEGLDFSFT